MRTYVKISQTLIVRCPLRFIIWLSDVPGIAKSRLELGNTSNIKWFDGIGEYNIDWDPGYRIYLAQDGKELIVLFGGGTKKNQQSDIENAKRLYEDYRKRKKEANEEVTAHSNNRSLLRIG